MIGIKQKVVNRTAYRSRLAVVGVSILVVWALAMVNIGSVLPIAKAYHSYEWDWICWQTDESGTKEWNCGTGHCDQHVPEGQPNGCRDPRPCDLDTNIDSCWPGPYRYYGPPEEGLPGGVPCTASTPCGEWPPAPTYECTSKPSTQEEKAACEEHCNDISTISVLCNLGGKAGNVACNIGSIIINGVCKKTCAQTMECEEVRTPGGGVLRTPDDGTSGGVLRTPPDGGTEGGVLRTPDGGTDAGVVIFGDQDADPVIGNPIGGTNDGDDGVVIFGDQDADPVIGNPDGGTDGGVLRSPVMGNPDSAAAPDSVALPSPSDSGEDDSEDDSDTDDQQDSDSDEELREEIEEDFDECPEGTTLVGGVDCVPTD
jgi:hypothetical protein